MPVYEIALKFDESERALIQTHADAAGMSFSELVKRTALEKAEDMADTEAYNEALDRDDCARYPMEATLSARRALRQCSERHCAEMGRIVRSAVGTAVSHGPGH